MHIYASSLAMMDLTANHCWIGVGLHLKARDAVSVDVAALKIALQMVKRR